ncbi:MAG: YbaB/EbfC family nucleoid-associated protein [Planctomycetota bacterium]|nr:YbaB/EbfC family nucleoid-associated protein [Planctomycetota bacterium]
MLGNFGDMMKLMGQAGQLREKMQHVQEQARKRVVAAESGGGMVKVTATGLGEVLAVEIDADALKDPETLGPLIAAAVNAAVKKGKDAVVEEMRQSLGGLDLPPGMLNF